jgi:hypothetical protein
MAKSRHKKEERNQWWPCDTGLRWPSWGASFWGINNEELRAQVSRIGTSNGRRRRQGRRRELHRRRRASLALGETDFAATTYRRRSRAMSRIAAAVALCVLLSLTCLQIHSKLSHNYFDFVIIFLVRIMFQIVCQSVRHCVCVCVSLSLLFFSRISAHFCFRKFDALRDLYE